MLGFGNGGFISLSSCEDWTEVESLDIHTPSLEEQNPQLYEDYLKDLNALKPAITMCCLFHSVMWPIL